MEKIGADCGDNEDQKHEATTLGSTYLITNVKACFCCCQKIVESISNKMLKYAAGAMWPAP